MSVSKRPEGYPCVSPYLISPGAEQVIAFVEKAFGGRVLRRYDAPDGRVAHAEIRIDDSVVMIGEAGPEWPAMPTHLHLYVDDARAAYARALEAGGTSVREPSQREGDPDLRGGVKDPAGNTWWVATQVV